MSSATSELKNTILRAGAGAGKTTTLTQTFLKFASDFKVKHDKFPRIVVTTFTRKATQELKERLLAKALQDGREDLFHYVSSKSQVQISTIHGVLSLFLSRYGSSIGLTPDYKIKSDAEIKQDARKIMRRFILEDSQYQELLEEYDFQTLEGMLLKYFAEQIVFPEMLFIQRDEQQLETESILRTISGKLRRICLEISQNISNDKWQEYAEAMMAFSWDVADKNWLSFFERLDNFWENISKPAFRKATPPFSISLHEELEELRDSVDKLLAEPRYRPAFWDKHQKNCEVFQSLAESFCEEFMKTKLENGLLSMGDLETLSYKMIHEAPESAVKFAQEWDFWMVDEYQDTSPVQVELLKHLIGEKPQFVVGDPQQSIYLFRGARSEVFQEKIKEIEQQDGDVQIKLVNYRSTPEVLEFFNHYFGRLGSHFASMTPAPDKIRKGNADPVAQLIITEADDSGEQEASTEVLSTVARIQELLRDGVSPEQICILSRTHKTLEDIAKVAQDYGLPLQLHSGSGFYERREVLDALALLKFLLNPHDNGNFVALLRSPWLVVSDSEIASYCHSFKHSFWKTAKEIVDADKESHPINLLKNILLESEKKGLSFTFKKALIQLGVFDYSAQIDSSGRREANLWKLVYLLQQEERSPGFNYLDFLDSSLETLSADEGGEDADATPVIEPKRVNFMTVHASKGLQFDHIILPGMGQDPRNSHASVLMVREIDGKWSLKVRNQETQAMNASVLAEQITLEIQRRENEELNRVLYVAMTRAKSGVTLIWDKKFGKRSWAAQCPLLIEAGQQYEKEFSYLVRIENLKPQKMEQQDLVHKNLRQPWQDNDSKTRNKLFSVTELAANDLGGSESNSPPALEVGLSRAQQGTNAHRLFESLKYTDHTELMNISEPEFKKALQFVAETQDIPLMRIIKNGHVEWGFTLSKQGLQLQGQIDLWGEVDEVVWIVDYKTGSQRYSETAFKQLEIYAWSLSEMHCLKQNAKIKLAVVYPMEQAIKIKEFSDFESINLSMETKLKEQV